MKTLFLALILSCLYQMASAASVTSVFTDKLFTSIGVPHAGPHAQVCAAYLMIRENEDGSLDFYTQEFGYQKEQLLFRVTAGQMNMQLNTIDQKRFVYQSGYYHGSAYYAVHSPDSAPFYEIMVQAETLSTHLNCRYSSAD